MKRQYRWYSSARSVEVIFFFIFCRLDDVKLKKSLRKSLANTEVGML